MVAFIVQRLLQGVVVIFLVSFVTFGILQMAPGSPVDTMIGEAPVSKAQREAIEEKWGLNDPWYEQYATWMRNMASGDLGTSVVRTGTPVSEMIREAAPVTLKLNAIALVIAVALAIPAGVVAAIRRYSWFDYGSMLGSTIGVAVPNFWIALMLIYLFSLRLGWVPPFGAESWRGYILPVAVLASEQTAVIARLTRGATLEVLNQEYVTTARSKGLPQNVVVVRHVVRNALLPIVSVLGYRIAFLLSGTIVIETIFAWPGIGRLFFDSIYRLDYQVVQAITLLLAALVVIGNLITDVVYAYVDPRIRLS
jgi:peptide/nickel transport system permease protein